MPKALRTLLLISALGHELSSPRPLHSQTATTIGTGTISGAIVDENGKAIPGARVIVQRLAIFATSPGGNHALTQPALRLTISASPTGTFSLSGLLPGQYHICGYGNPGQVSSCDWTGVPTFTPEDGQTVSGITRQVANGVLISIVVADPNGRLAGAKKFRIGLGDQYFYQQATLSSKVATSRTYQLSVPKSRTLKFFLDTDLATPVAYGLQQLEIGSLTSTSFNSGSSSSLTINLAFQ